MVKNAAAYNGRTRVATITRKKRRWVVTRVATGFKVDCRSWKQVREFCRAFGATRLPASDLLNTPHDHWPEWVLKFRNE